MLAPSEARVENKTKKLARRAILKRGTIKKEGRGTSSTGPREVNRERLCRGEVEAMVDGPRGGGGNSRLKKAMEERGGTARGINGEIVYIKRGPDTRREDRNDAINGQEEEGSTKDRALGHTLILIEGGGARRSDPKCGRNGSGGSYGGKPPCCQRHRHRTAGEGCDSTKWCHKLSQGQQRKRLGQILVGQKWK